MLYRPAVLVVSAALALTATSCSEDFPARDEFIAEAKVLIPTDLSDSLTDSKIDPAAANTLIEEHLGCIYDAIKADEALVDKYVSDPDSNATQSEIVAKSSECTERANKAILDAITASNP